MMDTLKQRLKRFVDDERAVSPVVGFVLMFALIMIVFTLYQSSVVPAQNEEVEFKHSQTVEGQMSQLNDAIQQAGASVVPQSVTIDTGVQYPDRALAINPGSPAGTLKTVDAPNVTLSGLSGGSGYWSDGETFETHLISYQPSYNLLQQETTYSLENGMFAKNFEGGNTLLKSNGSVISDDGKRINLVLVGGGYQKSQMTTSATVRPVSTSTEYLHLKPDDTGTIEIPTTLTKGRWRGLLDGTNVSHTGKQYADFGGYDGSGDIHTVTINLNSADQTYEIRLTKVRLGGSSESPLKYLKSKNPTDSSETIEATVGESKKFTVSTRDNFGNPVGGAEISATTNGSGTFARSDGTSVDNVATNDDGRATFTYKSAAGDAGNGVVVEFSIKNGNEEYETVTYELTFPNENNADPRSSLGVGDISNGYETGIVTDTVSNSKKKVTLGFKNIVNKTMTAKRVRVNGFLQKSANAASTPTVSFNGTQVQVNGNITPLKNSSEYTIPANKTRSVTLDFGTQIKKGGFLIVSIEYEYTTDSGNTETDTATYAVAVTGS